MISKSHKTQRSGRSRVRGDRLLMSGRLALFSRCLILASALALVSGCSRVATGGNAAVDAFAPAALVASPDGRTLYVACASASRVLVFSTGSNSANSIRHLATPAGPSGMALSVDARRLVVTCSAPVSTVVVFDTGSGKMLQRFEAGHSAASPVFGPGETGVFVCNRFNHEVCLYDLKQGEKVARIPVAREPVGAALTRDGKFLLVANHLPSGRSDVAYVAATVTVIDVAERRVVKNLQLPNGSINLREVRVSPDGKYAAVVHTVARFNVPVTQIHRGWVNTSALTLVDIAKLEVLNTVLLDEPDRGAADPWAVDWTVDGRTLCVAHAGTHELSLIDFPGLLKKLAAFGASNHKPSRTEDLPLVLQNREDPRGPSTVTPSMDLSFLVGLRQRVKLASNGIRSLAITQGKAYIAGYFSDTLESIPLSADLDISPNPGLPIPLNVERSSKPESRATFPFRASASPSASPPVSSTLRLGEQYFNDATLCFQGWQSCATCHDNDARVDGLNWDLLNDGIGNPKDTKSLVLSHKTPPVMSLGVRATAEVAVRSGIANSLSSVLPEEVPKAIDEWLKSLEPMASPYLVNGHFSPKASEGEKVFRSSETGCAGCHSSELFTDLRSYPVGTQNEFDRNLKDFDTPTLRELWRTAPYLHDGSAATIREVLTSRNAKDEHGKTTHLKASEIEALEEYLLSL